MLVEIGDAGFEGGKRPLDCDLSVRRGTTGRLARDAGVAALVAPPPPPPASLLCVHAKPPERTLPPPMDRSPPERTLLGPLGTDDGRAE